MAVHGVTKSRTLCDWAESWSFHGVSSSSFSIHADGHLGCFHVLAIVNSATMNTEVHVSFLIRAFVFSGYMPRSGIAGSYGNSVFSFSMVVVVVWSLSRVQLLQLYGLWPTRLLCPQDFSGKNTAVGCHFLSRGSSRPRDRTPVTCAAGSLLHCRWILHLTEPPGNYNIFHYSSSIN